MSNITIELRPPPNVDFVHGFPGIPPSGPERPQAAVKGAIEVRVPQTGVKAKWVRIELRKVEMLPPGGPDNMYWDCIGPSPINLWSASDEYGILRSQDFPFSIRIPESIPPSVELDNRACIGYELVASVCTKGKRGFLRKAKSVISTSKAPITIDKHELHSTWPIYNQPETRHMVQDGINLMVERSHTCFGPGDRVAVSVTVKSDSLHTVILRGFEIALRETTVLRAGPHGAAGRRTQPLTKTVSVGENKVMLNATMYGGQQRQAELSTVLSPKHTTPTLNAARHIDVTYTLMVKAVMGTGDNLVMDLPVIISNWQRDISSSAIGQIGPTPNLSNLPITPTSVTHTAQSFYNNNAAHTSPTHANAITTIASANANTGRTGALHASTLPAGRTPAENQRPGSGHSRQSSAGINMFSTANPAGGSGFGKLGVDEFGYSSSTTTGATGGGLGLTIGGNGGGGGSGRPTIPHINTGASAATARPTSSSRPTSRGNNAQNRLTIMNAHPSEMLSEENGGGGSGGARGGGGQPTGRGRTDSGEKPWLSAQDEKRLYEQARKQVETTQGPHAAPAPLNYGSPPPTAISSGPSVGGASSASHLNSSSERTWETAAQEKARLFNEAQAAVARAQMGAAGGGASPPTASNNFTSAAASGGSSSSAPPAPSTPSKPSGAQLYQQAMSARKPSAQANMNSSPPVPVYPTAEQEKAALRRYEQAREAVDRTQSTMDEAPSGGSGGGGGGVERESAPIPYETLFGAPGSNNNNNNIANEPPPPAFGSPPPAFGSPAPPSGPVGPVAILTEKERLRREYEARDAMAQQEQQQRQQQILQQQQQRLQQQQQPQRNGSYGAAPPPSFSSAPPPPFSPTPSAPAPTQYANAIAEKEALRRKFEAQDRAAAAVLPPPAPLQTPSRNSSAAARAGSYTASNGGAVSSSPLSPGMRPSLPVPGLQQVPAPLVAGGSSNRILTAAEEKALLRAKYDAQDNASPRSVPAALQPRKSSVNGVGVNGGGGGASTPPPLMPRPPVEYIQETREEDARVAKLDVNLKPYAPFGADFERGNGGGAPQLPPKPE